MTGDDVGEPPTVREIQAVLLAGLLALTGRLGGMVFGIVLTERVGVLVLACPGGLYVRPLLA